MGKSVMETYGFLPTSVKTYENVLAKYKHLDDLLDINLIRAKKGKYTNELKYSKFSFGLAYEVISYWSEKGDVILDPFCGWGIRGAMAIELKRNYIGYEVAKPMFDKAEKYLSDVKNGVGLLRGLDNSKGDYKIYLDDGCTLRYTEKESIDMILTCPPYFNLERYPSAVGQLSDLNNYKVFLRRLRLCFESCYNVLKKDKYCIFVVNDFRQEGKFHNFHNDTIDLAKDAGFKLWDIIISVLRSPYTHIAVGNCAERKYTHKLHEYILVFKK